MEGITTVHNLRDVSVTAHQQGVLRRGMLYRSATLDNVSAEDIKTIRKDLGVSVVLDLRSEVEIQAALEGTAFAMFPSAIVSHLSTKDLTSRFENLKFHEDGPRICDDGKTKTIFINFAGTRYRIFGVLRSCPTDVKMKVVYGALASKKQQVIKMVAEQVICPKGMIGLYQDFVNYCYEEIGQALKVLADPLNYPILVHCTHGKDRTGLVIGLSLAICGVPDEMIAEDYGLTAQGLAPVMEKIIAQMAKDGLDPTFASSPPELMIETLQYIREKYGSISLYLDRCKFTHDWRESLRRTMLISYEPTENPNPEAPGYRFLPRFLSSRRASLVSTSRPPTSQDNSPRPPANRRPSVIAENLPSQRGNSVLAPGNDRSTARRMTLDVPGQPQHHHHHFHLPHSSTSSSSTAQPNMGRRHSISFGRSAPRHPPTTEILDGRRTVGRDEQPTDLLTSKQTTYVFR